MFIKIPYRKSTASPVEAYYTCPLNAFVLCDYSNTYKLRWMGGYEKFLIDFDLIKEDYDFITNALKQANMLEAAEINVKAGKEIISPKFVNAIMGLEVWDVYKGWRNI